MYQLERHRRRSLTFREYEDLLPSDSCPTEIIELMGRSVIHPDDLIVYDPVTQSSESYWETVLKPEDGTFQQDPEIIQQLISAGWDLMVLAWKTAMETSQKSAAVMMLRLGLCRDGCPRTLDATARIVRVSRERVRQIEDQVLRKMRHPSRSNAFRFKHPGARIGTMLEVTEARESLAEIDAATGNAYRINAQLASMIAPIEQLVENRDDLNVRFDERFTIVGTSFRDVASTLRKVPQLQRAI
jgi:hypothetical protein